MSSNTSTSFRDGQLGFVLIPNNNAILFQQGSQRMYWPAILFSSHGALLRSIPSLCGRQSFRVEWKCHEMFFLSIWKRQGLLTPDDGPVKAALLLGSDIPPCATRSFPICPREMAVVPGGAPHQPYSILSKKKMGTLKEIEYYAGNNRFLAAMNMAEQYMNTKDTTSVCASLKWSEIPNGCYHGADPHGYTSEGWLWWYGDWRHVPALPSEAELERTYPTYKSYPKPPNQESYARKRSRIAHMHHMQLADAAQMREETKRKSKRKSKKKTNQKPKQKSTNPFGVSEWALKRREEDAQGELIRTGEMHLHDAVMAKISALPKGSNWRDTTLITIIHKSRYEWKERNAQNVSTDNSPDEQDSGTSDTSSSTGSTSSPSPSADSSTKSWENNIISGSDSAQLSAAALSMASSADAPRITPDKSEDDANAKNILDSSTSNDNDSDNAQPKPKKQKRSSREVDDLVIPGSLPHTGIDWNEVVEDISLTSAYGLDKTPQQPARTVICNRGQPFYVKGTGIQQVELHFIPKNMRFPNDPALMNQAAVNARTLIAAVFGGDELIGQRDRKYSAPKFHTVSMVDMTASPATSTPVNKCISALYFSQVEGTSSLWIEWFGTDVDYRGKKLGIGSLLLQYVLDLAILDEGVDNIYLEVGRDKEGKANWKAARHVYEKVGFVMENNRVPGEVAECCKHFGDPNYDVMRFDCEGKVPSRRSTRRGRGARSRSASESSS